MKRRTFLQASAMGLSALALTACSGSGAGSTASSAAASSEAAQTGKTVKLDPANPVDITIWHYYNGAQQESFSAMVNEFNSTTGAELGIRVGEFSQGSVGDLEQSVLSSVRKEVGAGTLPNIFAAYADTAYAVDQLGVAADLSPWLTQSELDAYVPGYLDEGYLTGDGLKIFPVAKSTEVLLLNATDWDKFAAATGAKLDDFKTLEGVTATAKAYYEWTAGENGGINNGKAFFGRDAFANYMLMGAYQLGDEIFGVKDGVCTLNFDKAVVRTLWDNYYVPMVAGWFLEENRFRSDDAKMGKIIAAVGSCSSASYFPDTCVISDTESYPIEVKVMAAPQFEKSSGCAVQQGAGMVVTADDEAKVYASVCFLKWFTEPERNARFAMSSGYLPVTREASTQSYLNAMMDANGTSEKLRDVLDAAVATTETNTMYTPRAFATGSDARTVLNDELPAKAAEDRAAFLALLDGGMAYEDALAKYTTDENFDAWYQEINGRLQALIDAQ